MWAVTGPIATHPNGGTDADCEKAPGDPNNEFAGMIYDPSIEGD